MYINVKQEINFILYNFKKQPKRYKYSFKKKKPRGYIQS